MKIPLRMQKKIDSYRSRDRSFADPAGLRWPDRPPPQAPRGRGSSGALFGSPCNRDHGILGYILWPHAYGSSRDLVTALGHQRSPKESRAVPSRTP